MTRPKQSGIINYRAGYWPYTLLLGLLLLLSTNTTAQPQAPSTQLSSNQQPANQNQPESTIFHIHELDNNPRSISHVNLHHLNLKTVPPELENCTNLKSLSLANNNIETLPPFIQQFRRLETLDLSGMSSLKATQLFDNIQALRQLKTLNLSNGDFVILPYQVTALQNLENLDLSENLFEDMPAFALELPGLKTLNMADNRLKKLNYDIYKLQELKTIDLSHNPDMDYNDAVFTLSFLFNLKDVRLRGLKTFPDEINKLQQINKLDLSEGTFLSIPAKAGDLTSLDHLNLNYCDKLDLKDALAKFGGNSQLQKLECINNKVYFFPKGLGKFNGLKELVLGGPLLKFIAPDFKKLNRLQALSIINAPLIDVRDLISRVSGFKSFRKLTMSRCNFTVFPPEVIELLALEELDLSGNQISIIPMSIGRLKGLKYLNLEGNPVNENDVQQVQIMLPDCKIIYRAVPPANKVSSPGNLFQITPTVFPITVTEENTITVDERISVQVPPDAFMTADGSPATGDAELHVIAITHPFDSWKHGLPTTIDSIGYQYDVHTAGQFEITAFQEGKPLKLQPDQVITIAFESTLSEKEELELLRYHPTGKTWGRQGWDEVVGKSNDAGNNPFGEGFSGIQRPGLPVAPVRPQIEDLDVSFYTNKRQPFISVKGKYHDDLQARQRNNNEKAFSDLTKIEQIAWIYDGDDWKQDSKVMDTLMNINQQLHTAKTDRSLLDDLCLSYGELSAKKAVDVLLENREGDNKFNLRFIRAVDTVNLPVISYELPEGKQFFSNYNEVRQQRQNAWEGLDENYLKALDDYQRKVDAYREEISNYSEDMGPLGGFKNTTAFQYKRVVRIEILGNHIIGKILYQDNQQIFTRYIDENNNTLHPESIILLDETRNNFVINKGYKLSYDPRSKNTLIALLGNGDIGLIPNGVFRQMNKNNEKEITEIPLILVKKSEISEQRIKSLLGM